MSRATARPKIGRRPRTPPSPIALEPTVIGPAHPICRGASFAVVFSGRSDVLGELAGEPTALIGHKFVMPDPTLSAREDFARSGGATLAAWDAADLQPMGGVCFVFTSVEHPAIARLLASGARIGDDVVITSGLDAHAESSGLQQRLSSFLLAAPRGDRIVLLGYGHQGQRISECLVKECDVASDRVVICDDNAQSIAQAKRDGFEVVDSAKALETAEAIIATPLSRYERIALLIDRARARGKPVFDNAQSCSGLQQWTRRGSLWLDEAAACALQVNARSNTVHCDAECLQPLFSAHIVRQDSRQLAGIRLPHLQSGQVHTFAHAAEFDASQPWAGDGLAFETFAGFERAFISLRNRADLGFFAARELCLDLWLQATRTIFPSEHAIDLGATAFERRLMAHLDAREIVATMQTPAQRVTLGVAAAHYASARPIIEIGSALGGSALLMACATTVHRPPIISIDPDAPTRGIMRFAFEQEGHQDRLQQIVRTSDQTILELSDLRERCGLIFVDGLHTAVAVRNDFDNYAPLVAIGGALAFHDVCPAIHSVMQAVVEHVLPDKRFRAMCLVDGLLVLERLAYAGSCS